MMVHASYDAYGIDTREIERSAHMLPFQRPPAVPVVIVRPSDASSSHADRRPPHIRPTALALRPVRHSPTFAFFMMRMKSSSCSQEKKAEAAPVVQSLFVKAAQPCRIIAPGAAPPPLTVTSPSPSRSASSIISPSCGRRIDVPWRLCIRAVRGGPCNSAERSWPLRRATPSPPARRTCSRPARPPRA
jgi:hypothetical protein